MLMFFQSQHAFVLGEALDPPAVGLFCSHTLTSCVKVSVDLSRGQVYALLRLKVCLANGLDRGVLQRMSIWRNGRTCSA
jgi:hypothetical protein